MSHRLLIYACLGLLLGSFALGLLLQVIRLFRGARAPGNHVAGRRGGWRRLFEDAILQRRLRRKPSAGRAHQAILYGFVLLLPRWVILIGRAIHPGFGGLSAGDETYWLLLSTGYQGLKNIMIVLVLLAVAWFGYARLMRRESRFAPSVQALAILAAIAVMLLADLAYDATGMALLQRPRCVDIESATCLGFAPLLSSSGVGDYWDPVTKGLGAALDFGSDEELRCFGTIAYWLHVLVGAAFLAALPHTKHLHVLAAWPNLYFDRPSRSARLAPVASSAEDLMNRVEAAMLANDVSKANPSALGKACLADFTAKERLDWFACSACGRCTEHCPATASGQSLDPMRVVQALRVHLQSSPLFAAKATSHLSSPLVPAIIDADAVWACTACGACEEQCPVAVRTVAPILEMRRDLLTMRGEAPNDLTRLFSGLQRQHNPYQRSHQERPKWAESLAVPLLADVESVDYLYWVGCAASYDDRAQSVARALVELMRRANVTFAILGSEERCTGDVARRAGNELLFLELAEHNIRTLSRYRGEKRFERIITTCPHCQTTLARDYADLGASFEVVPHVVAIDRWVSEGRLVLAKQDLEHRSELIAYHDPCTLARYTDVTREPRHLLDAAPGVARVEPERHGRQTHCCGGGGARYWQESSLLPSRHAQRAPASEHGVGGSRERAARADGGNLRASVASTDGGNKSRERAARADDGGSRSRSTGTGGAGEIEGSRKRAGEGLSPEATPTELAARLNVQRAQQLARTGAELVLTACPFCLTMLEDGMTSISGARHCATSDVAEFVELRTRPGRSETPHCQTRPREQ